MTQTLRSMAMPKWALTLTLWLGATGAMAKAILEPYPDAALTALRPAFDPRLLPPRARLDSVEAGQLRRLAGAGIAPLVLAPVIYTVSPGDLSWCGLYILTPSRPRAVRFLPAYNRVPDTYGQCAGLAAIDLAQATGAHPRIILVYNAFEPNTHTWQQPVVLTWRRASHGYVVSPAMPDQGHDMSPDAPDTAIPGVRYWTVARVRELLQRNETGYRTGPNREDASGGATTNRRARAWRH